MRTTLSTNKRQQGMTAGGWLLVLALVGFFVLLLLRLFPIYSNNYKMKGIVESLGQEQNIFTMQRKDILRVIQKRIGINMAKGFKQEHLVIKLLDNGKKEIHITYEDRRPIVGNLDIVGKFDDYIIVSRTGQVKSGI